MSTDGSTGNTDSSTDNAGNSADNDGSRADSNREAGQELATVTSLLHLLRERIGSARPVPMSGSVMVHKKDLLDELDRLAKALPTAFDEARQVLDTRDSLVDEGRAEAARLIARAEVEHHARVRGHDLHKDATQAAEELVDDAHGAAERTRADVDDYIDHRLAQVEVTLTRTLAQVQAGRRHLESGGEGAAARALGELHDDGGDRD